MEEDTTGKVGRGVDRRTFVQGATGVAALAAIGGLAPAATGATGDNLTWASAAQIREMVANRQVSALEVTNHFLGRIDRLEPQLHMFRHVDHDGARDAAREVDRAIAAGEPVGSLAGVPVSLKEHIAVKGMPELKMASLEGSDASFPLAERDSIVAERLRAAGAIIVGMNIMPGMGEGPGMTDLAEHPRNPWDPERVPGSSSAGGAAAVAAAAVPIAIGSDGGGSTRLPAALCGIVGVHPTIGRVPNVDYDRPHLMLSTTFGPLARDARDAAIVLQAIAGPDGRDSLSSVHPPAPDYLSHFDDGAHGMKLGWTDDYGFAADLAVDGTPQVIAKVREAAMKTRELGASVTPVQQEWESFWPHTLTTDAAYGSNRAGREVDAAALAAASEARQRNRAKFDALFEEYDILMSPTIQFTAPTVQAYHNSWRDIMTFSPIYTAQTFMFNWIGLPAISVPVGFLDGLPVGLQLVGQPDSEPRLFALAHAILERFPQREQPSLA